jgi:hypothetical protein
MFILVIFAIATLLGGAVHRARTQREAIRAIRTLGGHFSFDPSYRQSRGPAWKNWRKDRIGADYFYHVEYVTSLNNMTDANFVGDGNRDGNRDAISLPRTETGMSLRPPDLRTQ